MLLKGKTALVYGAGGAVGGAMARAFAREGALVILAGRTAATLELAAADIRSRGGRAVVEPVDALDDRAVGPHFDRIAAAYGPIGVMVNAISWADTQGVALSESTYERYFGAVAAALKTWFLTGTAAARHMAGTGGVIVGVTADVGRIPMAMVNGFGVACAAVEHFLRQLAVENGPAGVRVCFVRSAGASDAPGVVEAFKLRAQERGTTLEAELAAAGRLAPLRRLPSLAEMADAAVLVASDYARGMTATLANVTCGAILD